MVENIMNSQVHFIANCKDMLKYVLVVCMNAIQIMERDTFTLRVSSPTSPHH